MRSTCSGVALSALLVLPSAAISAGFGVAEQSASALGSAFAGTGANSENASSQWYNPATLTGLESDQVSVVAHQVMVDTSFDDNDPTTTGEFEDVNTTVPAFYLARDLNEDVTFGLGVNAPFGTTLEYERNWGGDAYALKSDLKSLNVNPSLSFEATDRLHLGVGVNYQKIEAELDNSQTRLEGDDKTLGWNAGIRFLPAEGHSIGLAYRSKMDYEVNGDITFKTAGQTFNARTNVTMPETWTLAYAGDMAERTRLLLSVKQTEWSRLETLTVTHDGPSPPFPNPVEEQLNWEDFTRSSIGVSHELVGGTVLRAGYAHETSTQESADNRSALVPDNDRDWLTLGATFEPTEQMSVDVGYAHVMVDDADIDRAAEPSKGRGPLNGTYELAANIVGAQLNYKF